MTLQEARAWANAAARTKYLDWRQCDHACHEFDEILYEAEKLLKGGNIREAFLFALFIFHKCMWLASYADSSSGSLGTSINYSLTLISQVCDEAESNEDKEFILKKCISESKNKVHDGWDEHFTLLRHAAKVVDVKTVLLLEAALTELRSRRKNDENDSLFNNILDRGELLVRLDLIKNLEGISAYKSEIMNHLEIDELRYIAIELAIADKDYELAEILCKGGIENNSDYYWSRKWYLLLTDLYNESESTNKYIEVLRERLLVHSDAGVFESLKDVISDQEDWSIYYPKLLTEMEEKMRPWDYMGVLDDCEEYEKLLKIVKLHSSYIEAYFDSLFSYSPSEACSLFSQQLEEESKDASDRKKYRQICRKIKRMSDKGGYNEAMQLIDTLKYRYGKHPGRRPSMLEELEKTKVKLI